jgi:hypothetical protein
MLSYGESSNPDGGSSSSQMSGQITTRARGKHSAHQSSSAKRRKGLPDHHPDEQPEEDDDYDERPPPGPPAPDTDMRPKEITHDTDIKLHILIDGQDKGDFVELETSVKVRRMTQQSDFFLNLRQFYPIPNAKELSDSDKNSKKAFKPKIEAHIVRLKMRKSTSVQIDSATGSLGFLAHQRSYLRLRDL